MSDYYRALEFFIENNIQLDKNEVKDLHNKFDDGKSDNSKVIQVLKKAISYIKENYKKNISQAVREEYRNKYKQNADKLLMQRYKNNKDFTACLCAKYLSEKSNTLYFKVVKGKDESAALIGGMGLLWALIADYFGKDPYFNNREYEIGTSNESEGSIYIKL